MELGGIAGVLFSGKDSGDGTPTEPVVVVVVQ